MNGAVISDDMPLPVHYSAPQTTKLLKMPIACSGRVIIFHYFKVLVIREPTMEIFVALELVPKKMRG